MRYTLLLLFCTLALLTGLEAQNTVDSLDRKGKVWLDGSADLNASIDQLRAGYFFTDRLLVGSSLTVIGNDDAYVSPFVRFYLNGSEHKWRPYGEAGFQLAASRFDIEQNHFALGLERAFNKTTLLNLEFRYTNRSGRAQIYSVQGSLNTVLGGIAWRKAASQHFKAGTFVLGNQLFEAAISSANSFSYNYINVSPSVDYFLTDRLALQGSIDLARTSFDQSSIPTNRNYDAYNLNLRGGARYYLTTKSLFNIFAEGGLTYESRLVDREVTTGSERTTFDYLRADLGLGTSVFINPNTSIDFGANLNKGLLDEGNTFVDGFLRLKFWLK